MELRWISICPFANGNGKEPHALFVYLYSLRENMCPFCPGKKFNSPQLFPVFRRERIKTTQLFYCSPKIQLPSLFTFFFSFNFFPAGARLSGNVFFLDVLSAFPVPVDKRTSENPPLKTRTLSGKMHFPHT